MSKCDSCRSYNAHVIILEDERMILCPRCLGEMKKLSQEYFDIVSQDDREVDEQTSSERNSEDAP